MRFHYRLFANYYGAYPDYRVDGAELDASMVPSGTQLILTEFELPYAGADFIKSLVRPQITHLRIGPGTTAIDEWVGVLSDFPALLQLKLDFDTRPSDAEIAELKSDPTFPPKRIATLPSLQYLHLAGHHAGLKPIAILRHLTFPSTTAIHFRGWQLKSREDVARIPLAFQVMSSAIHRSTDHKARAFRSVRMRWYVSSRFFVVDTWPTVRTVAELNNDFKPGPGSLSVSFGAWSPLAFRVPAIVRPFMSSFPLADVQALAVVGPGQAPFWSQLTGLRGVTDLSVAILLPTLKFAQVFASEPSVLPGDDPEQKSAVLFPDLRTLTVTASGETDKGNNGRALVKRLQDALL